MTDNKLHVPISLDLKYVLKTIIRLAPHPSVFPRLLGGPDALNRLLRELYAEHRVSRVRTHNFEIYLDPDDFGVSPSISVLGWHELKTTELFVTLIRNGSTVVDVGANVGYFTLLAARLAGKQGSVISFEPEPMSFSLLAKSVQKNNFENVLLFQKCVSNGDGEQVLHLSVTQNKGLHSITKKWGGPTIVVPSTRLDTIADSLKIAQIDLLKIDVEGAEPEVLEGASRLISQRKVKNVIMEWDHPESWAQRPALLASIFRSFDVYRFARSVPFVPARRLTLSSNRLFNSGLGANVYLRQRDGRLSA